MRLLAFLLSSPAFAATLLKVACGGPGGAGWVPDAPYVSGGSTQAVAGVSTLPYNFLRFAPVNSSIRYSFPSLTATSVTLFFVEPRLRQAVGLRVFSVSVNGVVVIPALDLFASVGTLIGTSYTFPVPSSDAGPLSIVISSSVGNSVLSGLLIEGDAPLELLTGQKGPVAKRPPCPGPVDLYSATDTQRLYWCDGTVWWWLPGTQPTASSVCICPSGGACGWFVGGTWEPGLIESCAVAVPPVAVILDPFPGLLECPATICKNRGQ